jgi:UDP-glucose 4-epimerase
VPKILVLGANGFIGSRFVEAARSANWAVTAADRYSYPPNFTVHSNLTLVKTTKRVEDVLSGLPDDFDFVINCLASSTPIEAEKLPRPGLQRLYERELNIINAVAQMKNATYVFLSSGGTVYGESPEYGSAETDELLPKGKYASLKVGIENRLLILRESGVLNSLVLRFSTLYGPNPRNSLNQGFINIAMNAALNNTPIRVFSNRIMTRDYLSVDDAVALAMRLLSSARNHAVFNVGSGVGMTLQEVLATVASITRSTLVLVNSPAPTELLSRSVLDISRLTNELKEITVPDLATGIVKTWDVAF